VILEKRGQYEEVLVKQLQINVPSFSKEDEMPVVGRKYHVACYGRFALRTDLGLLIQKSKRRRDVRTIK
jgi:hypothetical protein